MGALLRKVRGWLGWSGIAFLILLILYLTVPSIPSAILVLGLLVTGLWTAVHLIRRLMRHAIWRLRNRLLLTCVFIAVVPITLILGLVLLSSYILTSQLAVYLVTSELDRHIDVLARTADAIAAAAPQNRSTLAADLSDQLARTGNPDVELLVLDGGRELRIPQSSTMPAPVAEWTSARGLVLREGQPFLWSHLKSERGSVTITVPMTLKFLSALAPGLGTVDFFEPPPPPGKETPKRLRVFRGNGAPSRELPPALNRFDSEVSWFASFPPADWNKPGTQIPPVLVRVRTRASAVLASVFNRQADFAQNALVVFLVAGLVVFVLVEIASLVAGIGLTRTITRAVHHLYEGTQRVIEGDFSHRIDVKGHDQLADLSRSFNRMTENIEGLLVVAKEKERLQSEIQIAREVQNQLFPRELPKAATLRLIAVCHPARMVSGDYYDYVLVRDSQIAIALGDVAGKGISAALLMAALQSSLRIQLQSLMEVAATVGDGPVHVNNTLSTSLLVSRLNRQLFAATSPEKYATFCLGLYDDTSGVLTYTNAGHLPPVLIREGKAERLDVNGTVVGAFSFAKYAESSIAMQAGDLLVWFTDGVTEPENSYGEMFGEDRLVDLLLQNSHREESEIVSTVIDAVRQWTGAGELQDDMTLLLARRL